MCAGITVYSPMMRFGLRTNMRFGVVGLGGLGHTAVKFGVAFGNHTTVISRGKSKKDSALFDLRADGYIDSTNQDEMKVIIGHIIHHQFIHPHPSLFIFYQTASGKFDFLICTISAQYDINAYLDLLAPDGQFIIVGAPPAPLATNAFPLLFKRVKIAGSLIGGLRETQEMLDFCGKKNITCEIEVIDAKQIDKAFDRTVNGDVKYRFVIDVSII